MPGPLLQSAINVSEGRRADVIRALVEAGSVPDAVVADWSADPDHNRMVITLLGPPDALARGAVAIAREAVSRIELRHHTGAHPRLGAVDVIPLVPIRGVTMDECVRLSREIGETLGRDLELPVYLYEASAGPGRFLSLPDIRKGGFEGLFTSPLDRERRPDYGPHTPHSTAGAVVVGARGPLVAYNVNLRSPSVAEARKVAALIRAERGVNEALAGVRALGLWLLSRGIAQVSMNLTRPDVTSMPAVFEFVRSAAERLGADVIESEVIGLAPESCLAGEPPERILWHGFRESQVLEYWMERL